MKISDAEVVCLALVKHAKEIQEDLGDIKLSDVMDVLFKFGNTVLAIRRAMEEAEEAKREAEEVVNESREPAKCGMEERVKANVCMANPMFV